MVDTVATMATGAMPPPPLRAYAVVVALPIVCRAPSWSRTSSGRSPTPIAPFPPPPAPLPLLSPACIAAAPSSLSPANSRRLELSRIDRSGREGPPCPSPPPHRRNRAGDARLVAGILDFPRLGRAPPARFPIDADHPSPRRPSPRAQGELRLLLALSRFPSPSHRRSPSPWSPCAAAPPRPCSRPGPATRPDASGRCPAWAPVWAGHEAGSLRHRPGLAPVWAGCEAGHLCHRPGL